MQNEVPAGCCRIAERDCVARSRQIQFQPKPDVIAHRQRSIEHLAQRNKEATKQEIGAHLRRLHKRVIEEVARQEKNKRRDKISGGWFEK